MNLHHLLLAGLAAYHVNFPFFLTFMGTVVEMPTYFQGTAVEMPTTCNDDSTHLYGVRCSVSAGAETFPGVRVS